VKQKVNVHMYPSPFTHETRILRITNTLARSGVFDRIHVVAAQRERVDLAEHEDLDLVRHVWRVPTRVARRGLVGKVVNALEWSVRVLWYFRKEPVACINVRTLSVLPVGVLLKLLKRARLIYDVHEIETETPEITGVRRTASKLTESILVRFADEVAVTSDMHGQWYESNLKLPHVWVVRNYPYQRVDVPPTKSLLREAFDIPPDHFLFLYQGAIAKPRGTDLLMRVFSRLPADRHIAFMGFGDPEDMEELSEYRRRHPNIHYHPAVPPAEVWRYTSGADAGIHMMDDSCVNHLYALPNKPMEYMNAGIPAIVSDLPQMGALIRDAGAGWVVPVNDGERLESLIRSMTRADLAEKGRLARQWAREHTWETQELILHSMYERLGFAARSQCSTAA
jgi:glycosyltransferase involved in cell wall biosynthesis